jgi:hypothetical protein
LSAGARRSSALDLLRAASTVQADAHAKLDLPPRQLRRPLAQTTPL